MVSWKKGRTEDKGERERENCEDLAIVHFSLVTEKDNLLLERISLREALHETNIFNWNCQNQCKCPCIDVTVAILTEPKLQY